MFNKSIERDFGRDFLFSMETLNVTEEDLEKYQSGIPLDTDKFNDCNVRLFTDGYYPKVVRLSKDIPTFDSGDREYDSWHDLYLVQEQSGNIHAVYCTGGYRCNNSRIRQSASITKQIKEIFSLIIITKTIGRSLL
jgi:hypothetical protein